ncbi:MAG: ketoacyl-ACP synthase III [Candidatus Hydrogenedentes bacterium]|nr:ketoacyl-ACP synthase III [Candidatus Hydrogenedentota bacterium]
MIHARIIGTGHYLPERLVTNDDLAQFVETSDEWVRQRTGIEQRYFAAKEQAVSDLGTEAGRKALADAGVTPEEVDYVICATLTPDFLMPSSACVIQHNLGCARAGASDLNAACSGFVYGLQHADALIRAGVHKTILVVGAEKLSDQLVWDKRDTAVLFGDGAGAAVLQARHGEHGVLSTYTRSDGSAAEILSVPSGGSRQPIRPDNVNDIELGVAMNGRELYKRAIGAFGEAIEVALHQTGLKVDEIDLFIPHQANKRIIDSAAKRVGLAEEKIYLNVMKVANTSAASIPIAIDQARAEGRLKEGDTLLLAAFGGGLTWASAMIRW